MASTGAAVEQAFMTQQILTNGRRARAFEIVGRGDDDAIVGGQFANEDRTYLGAAQRTRGANPQ
jgi:hypothetical protein